MRTMNRILLGAIGVMLVLPACSGTGVGKKAVEVTFAGKCVDNKGHGVPSFSLSVGSSVATTAPQAVTVATTQGQFDTRVSVERPNATPSSGPTLGSHDEKITVKVSAKGYKAKSFTVTAEKIFVGKPNTLNVTLEPSS